MAKAIKFPLEMDGEQVRDIDSLKEHFDIEKVVEYFLSGKLLTWLEARYYDDEAEAVAQLSSDDPDVAGKLCDIFGIEHEEEPAVDVEAVAERNARIAKLKEYTDDDEIIKNVDSVAFDQEDLAALYDRGAEKIWLCAGAFRIPKSKSTLTYTLIGGATADGLTNIHTLFGGVAAGVASMATAMLGLSKSAEKTKQPLEEINITEHIVVAPGEKKEYRDAVIHISSRIVCLGELSFINCEIACDEPCENEVYKDDELYYQPLCFRIFVKGGSLRFQDCRIDYAGKYNNENHNETRKAFIFGKDAEVAFESCTLNGCKNLFSRIEHCKVVLDRCNGQHIEPPLITYCQELYVTNCKLISGAEPIDVPGADDNHQDLLAGERITVDDSSFEGFLQGVIFGYSTINAHRDTFTDCAYIGEGPYVNRNFQECSFIRCFNSIKSGYELTMKGCQFIDCYGKLSAGRSQFDSCNWNGGFSFLDCVGASFSYCTFENISVYKAQDCLHDCDNNGFKYVRFSTNEKIRKAIGYPEDARYMPRALIRVGADQSGMLFSCKFSNIDGGGIRYILSYGEATLERCSFDCCKVSTAILDQESVTYTTLGGNSQSTTIRKTYHIIDCIGV